MARAQSISIAHEALGEPAPNRGQVDLLVEASRLKFSESEIAELKRLYAVSEKTSFSEAPQSKA